MSRRSFHPAGASAVFALAAVLGACASGDPASPWTPLPDAPGAPEASASSAAADANDVGSVTIRRLNRVEYDNTIFDLLGDDSHYSASFPPDDGAESFTNIADALSISPLLFEHYESAAERAAARALRNPAITECARPGTEACATEALGRLAKRAFRRRVGDDEVARLVAVVREVQADGDTFELGMQRAIHAMLLSPSFLFRAESDPDPGAKTAHPLDDYELANRLSYFLWSTMPDDALFAYADAGKLSDPRIFELQVRRMIASPKADALVANFASAWLVHSLPTVVPDPVAFPTFDEDLRASMGKETSAFLSSFLFGDQSLADMFDARFTFVDARLAKHYGLPPVTGTSLVRVELDPATHRGGLLTQASILTMTSVATRTSPVRRGAWVLSELLCAPPPPPPPGIPALEAQASVGTIRERMEQHRKNPVCATCHSRMDPIGFAMENFDALGRYRETDNGQPIDATGELPGGTRIDGAAELAAALKADPRFPRCATRKMYTYALGRAPAGFDEPRLVALTQAFAQSGYRTRALIETIVHTDAFRMRRGGQ